MHPFLAEYHRAVVLREGARELRRTPMFDDTGGYSRTNVYRLNDSAYVLVDAEGSFMVEPERRVVRPDDTRPTDVRSRGAFIGAFDVDSSRGWRFIPARERAERPAELRGGKDYLRERSLHSLTEPQQPPPPRRG